MSTIVALVSSFRSSSLRSGGHPKRRFVTPSISQDSNNESSPTQVTSCYEEGVLDRRGILRAATWSLLVPGLWSLGSGPSKAGLPAQVGTYLPAGEDKGFSLFIPDAKKTPALRAGTVDPSSPYQFEIPTDFRESKVANILSGNYCQPRCDEPWTEVIFEESSSGRIALLASPLKKLTSKPEAGIEEIGPPEGILEAVGSYITGTFLDEESVISMEQKRQTDGRVYYYYEVDSPYGLLGRHSYSVCTTKGEVAFILVASATDKQWTNSKNALQRVTQSFRA